MPNILLVDDDTRNISTAIELGFEGMNVSREGQGGMTIQQIQTVTGWRGKYKGELSLRAIDWDGTNSLGAIHMTNDIQYMAEYFYSLCTSENYVQYDKKCMFAPPINFKKGSDEYEACDNAIASVSSYLTSNNPQIYSEREGLFNIRLSRHPSVCGDQDTRDETAKFVVAHYKELKILSVLHLMHKKQSGAKLSEHARKYLQSNSLQSLLSAPNNTLELIFGPAKRQKALLKMYLSADNNHRICIASHGTEPKIMRMLLVELARKNGRRKDVEKIRAMLHNGLIKCDAKSVSTVGRHGTTNKYGYEGKTDQILKTVDSFQAAPAAKVRKPGTSNC
ncbi:hypothetical protein MMH89_02960 [Candidatus Comchoanobacter bicostacola]|uniref:Response regulatory domain-containing protein n=1 Tax=Candidatus Comchoanobacter bicostacola TaxID=2919598 RepID=A0ABY5DJH4_9GAMM|nr:hypothetical protein [Candidatus Comchoanobacter bicostacola]UTC24182.1 hypothetical protein MMH89_02960 [Candidatus Comchoanobacter bicostacola]